MIFFRLFLLSVLFLFLSCSPRDSGTPSRKGEDIHRTLSEHSGISTINASFAVQLEKPETTIRGEGDLDLDSSGDLDIQVYSLGFLALKLTSKNGIIKSTPVLSSERKKILAHGLRDCLFWWDIRDFSRSDEKGLILLKNKSREIWFDEATHLPVTQKVHFSGGKTLTIRYENPVKIGTIWYQSKIRIELSKYAVTLNLKEIELREKGALSSQVRGQQPRS